MIKLKFKKSINMKNLNFSFIIFSSPTISRLYVYTFNLIFFFFNLNIIYKPSTICYLFKPFVFTLFHNPFTYTPKLASVYSVNFFYFINKYRYQKTFYLYKTQFSQTPRSNYVYRSPIVKNSKNKYVFYKLFKQTYFWWSFFGKISRVIMRTLTVRGKKNKISYDSFYLPTYLYQNLTRFEMTRSFLNFNKNLMLKFNLSNHIVKHNNFKVLPSRMSFDRKDETVDFSQRSSVLSTRKLLKTTNSFSSFSFLYPTYNFIFEKYNFKHLFAQNSPLKTLLTFINYPLLTKFIFSSTPLNDFTRIFFDYLKAYYFYNYLKPNNLFINNKFSFQIKKKIIKIFNFKKFTLLTTPWQNNTFIRFIEYCSGSKIFVKFFFFLNFLLTENEKVRCIIWFQKLKTFQKSIGNGFFLYESIEIIYIALKTRDPYFLINWISRTLHKINFWRHRAFFHYIKYIFKYFFIGLFEELKIKGIKFRLKGKISVTGNARTRKINCYIGKTGMSTYENKILHSLELIRTFTGVMGLQIWLIF